MSKSKPSIWTFTVAMAGFLFGFDTIVISGAEKTLQDIWGSSELFHGWVVVSSALWGTVLGAILGGIPTDKWGRKKDAFLDRNFVQHIGDRFCNGRWSLGFCLF